MSNITFVPATDFVGTTTVVFTAYNSAGTAFSGALTVTVGNTQATAISYSSKLDTPVSFRPDDFNAISVNLTGKALSRVVFTLPASTVGRLYYDYDSSSSINTPVLADTAYYRSASPYISNVSFVPASGYHGVALVSYTAYNVDGTSYTGTVRITFREVEEDGSQHFHDVKKNLAWAAEAIDYLFEHGIISGTGSGYYNPNASISRGDFILMLCRAFDLRADAKGNFSDVDSDSYYSGAIAVAKELKIAKGGNEKFNPRSALSRQDAMVLIYRALEAADITIEEGSELDLRDFSDRNKISDYAVDAVAAMVKADIIKGYGGKLSPQRSVSRAEMAVILYRILTE